MPDRLIGTSSSLFVIIQRLHCLSNQTTIVSLMRVFIIYNHLRFCIAVFDVNCVILFPTTGRNVIAQRTFSTLLSYVLAKFCEYIPSSRRKKDDAIYVKHCNAEPEV